MNYYEILKYTWVDMAQSDYLYRSNSRRKVIEMDGRDCDCGLSKESVIVIMYNVMTGVPLILTEKFYHTIDAKVLQDVASCVSEKFNVTVEQGEDSNGNFTEVICIRKSFYNSVMQCDDVT